LIYPLFFTNPVASLDWSVGGFPLFSLYSSIDRFYLAHIQYQWNIDLMYLGCVRWMSLITRVR
jgi:hypothetical protein